MSVVNAVRRMLGDDGDGWSDIEPVPLTRDEIHDLLSVDRRRLLLSYLVCDRDGVASLSDIAEHIGMVENGLEPTDHLSSSQRKRVYVSIYQTHIPKLADYAVVEYDEDRNLVIAEQVARELVKIDRGVASVATEAPA